MMDDRAKVLEVEKISRTFGDYRALDDVSFCLFDREIVALIGPNGAGKTTLMECVAGLQPDGSGTVKSSGAEIPLAQRRRHLFYQPDQVLPYSDHQVMTTLEFFRQMFGAPKGRLEGLIERLKLESVLGKNAGQLSRGYQKRLLLAIGLLSEVSIVLLDEPFEGLDLKQTREVVTLLKSEREGGRTLLLSIHQITDAERIADRFLLINNGKVLGAGSLDELRELSGLPHGSLEDVFLFLIEEKAAV